MSSTTPPPESPELLRRSIAHDFNNLLMVIGSNVEMAQKRVSNGQAPDEELATIREAVESGSALVRRLLDPEAAPPEGAEGEARGTDTPPTLALGEPPSNGATILIAEDEERLRRLARRFLESMGFNVLLAADGEEALAVFEEHQETVDAVILDSVMPRLSGPTAYEAMLRRRPGLPCIFVTGYTEEMSDEVDDSVVLLRKPISYTELGRQVRALIRAS